MRTLILICLLLTVSIPALAQDRTITLNSLAYSMRLAPDGQTIATFEIGLIHNNQITDDLLPIRLFDVETGEQRAELAGPSDYASDITFSPDSRVLASYHPTGFLYLWDVASGDLLNEIHTLPNGGQIKFMPNNRTLVLASTDMIQPYLAFIDTETGAISQVLMQRFPNIEARDTYLDAVRVPAKGIVTFEVMPSGEAVVLANALGNISLWNIAGGHESPLRVSEEEIPTFPISTIRATASTSLIVYANQPDNTLNSINLETHTEDSIAEGDIQAFDVASNDERVVWLQDNDGEFTLHVASLLTGEQTAQIPLVLPQSLRIIPRNTTLKFTPSGQQVVIGGFMNAGDADNQIMIVDVP